MYFRMLVGQFKALSQMLVSHFGRHSNTDLANPTDLWHFADVVLKSIFKICVLFGAWRQWEWACRPLLSLPRMPHLFCTAITIDWCVVVFLQYENSENPTSIRKIKGLLFHSLICAFCVKILKNIFYVKKIPMIVIVKRKRSQSKTAETKYFLPSFACILNTLIVIPKCFFVTPPKLEKCLYSILVLWIFRIF